MKSTLLAFVALSLSVVSLSAQTTRIERFLYAGPVVMQAPVMLDTIDAELKGGSGKSLRQT